MSRETIAINFTNAIPAVVNLAGALLMDYILPMIIGAITYQVIKSTIKTIRRVRAKQMEQLTLPARWENLQFDLMDYNQVLTDLDFEVRLAVHKRNMALAIVSERKRGIRQIERRELKAERRRRREEKKARKLVEVSGEC